ncbi:benzoate/H(+) symporter BenE family transporter [Imbroritus primus]|uniref:benzoate/H(+) symporter BenE family transporter n=1 Tax=Imbroritus primus TaxID=3058603 RepID=UPI003D1623B3
MPPTARSDRPAIRSPLSDLSLSAVVAGFVATLTGYASSLVLIIQAGQAAGLGSDLIVSWIWATSIGTAITSIFLSLTTRTPIGIAWSTPGAALLIASLPTVPYPEAIGAFLFAAVLMIIVGVTGWFDKLIRALPASIAAALLAGILFRISMDMFVSAQSQTSLILPLVAAYLLAKRFIPRYAVLTVLVLGMALAAAHGDLHTEQVTLAFGLPVWTTPAFSMQSCISIGIPLFVVALASQNIPGLAVLRADGYTLPASPLISATGIASLVSAPFGSHGINLAAITAAMCTGPSAHEDPSRRYMAAVACGVFYLIGGTLSASIASIFGAFPKALILSIAGLALLGSIANGLSGAMSDPQEREPALFTFMITASGLTLFGIGSAFWGLVGGLLALLLLRQRSR